MLDDLKIAIVCDWLTVFAGAERVVYELHKLFPKAPIFTSLYDEKTCKMFANADIRESALKFLPFSRKLHRLYFPLMPKIFEKMDFSEFDIVISSSHSAAKGIITKPSTLHVCYCHSPMRYVWDQSHTYQKTYQSFLPLKFLYAPILHSIRQWDRLAAERVDVFLANSNYVARRIKKYYRRESKVVYPPVNLDFSSLPGKRGNYYLAVGRLIPYKKFDLIIEAFNKLKLPLKIVGEGSMRSKLKTISKKNIEFLGKVSDSELGKIYAGAKALIFPQIEDFGIVPLEAMSCGTPVIAFAKGGVLETVTENVSGLFFKEQTEKSLIEAVKKFEKMRWKHSDVEKSTKKFSPAHFRSNILHFIDKAWKEHKEMLISGQ